MLSGNGKPDRIGWNSVLSNDKSSAATLWEIILFSYIDESSPPRFPLRFPPRASPAQKKKALLDKVNEVLGTAATSLLQFRPRIEYYYRPGGPRVERMQFTRKQFATPVSVHVYKCSKISVEELRSKNSLQESAQILQNATQPTTDTQENISQGEYPPSVAPTAAKAADLAEATDDFRTSEGLADELGAARSLVGMSLQASLSFPTQNYDSRKVLVTYCMHPAAVDKAAQIVDYLNKTQDNAASAVRASLEKHS